MVPGPAVTAVSAHDTAVVHRRAALAAMSNVEISAEMRAEVEAEASEHVRK